MVCPEIQAAEGSTHTQNVRVRAVVHHNNRVAFDSFLIDRFNLTQGLIRVRVVVHHNNREGFFWGSALDFEKKKTDLRSFNLFSNSIR